MTMKEYIHKHGIREKRIVYEAAAQLPNRMDFEEWRMNRIVVSMLAEKIAYHRNLAEIYEEICRSIAASENRTEAQR